MSTTVEEEFRRRLRLIMQQFGSVADLAKAVGVSDNAIYKWVAGRGQPSMGSLVNLAKAAGVSVEWLATGLAPTPALDVSDNDDDAGLAVIPTSPIHSFGWAGARSAQNVDYVRFDTAWLQRRFANIDPSRLMLIEVEGDAMAPTITDGDLCLIDLRQTGFRNDGLYALRTPDVISIKRLQREPDGTLIIRSDNPAYAPVRIAADQLTVIGRVIWIAGSP